MPGAPPPPPGSVAAALLARHAASPQPPSRAVTAVLRSVLDVLAERSLDPTPAALFAACMASLERGEARADGEVRGEGIEAGRIAAARAAWGRQSRRQRVSRRDADT